ncbi:helix-turn-helix domain-containing protein [Cohnella massiliensis]|uniref:helix-turn-helix domain-containing protein n=1 Tax=Paenibacillaceae TaxID=186822 RepID=UPI0009BA0035
MLGHEWTGDTTASRIRKKRVEKGYTIRALASLIGLTETSLISIENERSTPSLQTLRLLAEALNVSVAYLGCFEALPERNFPEKLTKARTWHGLTKSEMADRIGVDVKTLRGWEMGIHEPLPRFMPILESYLEILHPNQ